MRAGQTRRLGREWPVEQGRLPGQGRPAGLGRGGRLSRGTVGVGLGLGLGNLAHEVRRGRVFQPQARQMMVSCL